MNSSPQPGTWIDDLKEPLHTEADVKDLFERVEKMKAKFAAKTCHVQARCPHDPAKRIVRNPSAPWDPLRLPSTLAAGSLRDHAIEPTSSIIACMNNKPLLPDQWIDDLPEPLETVEDVDDLFERVDELKAARLEAAILRASKN